MLIVVLMRRMVGKVCGRTRHLLSQDIWEVGFQICHSVEEGLYCSPDLILSNELNHSFDFWLHESVFFEWLEDGSNKVVDLLKGVCTFQRLEELHALTGCNEFQGEDGFDVLDNLQGLPCSEASHGNVVFLIATSRDGVGWRWMTENFILRNQRSCTKLDGHESTVQSSIFRQESREPTQLVVHQSLQPPFTHLSQFLDTYGQVIQGFGRVFSMEIAPWDYLFLIRENQRVVRCWVKFLREDSFAKFDGLMNDSVDLRDTSESVGILNPATVSVGLGDFWGVQIWVKKSSKSSGNIILSLVRSDSMNF